MKHYSTAAKRRARKAKAGVEDLYRQFDADAANLAQPVEIDDPLATVRQARARQTGFREADVMHEKLCEDAGRAIAAEAETKDEADALWRIFAAYDQAEWVYFARVIGRPRFPAVSKLEFMPERFETRPDDRLDLRTPAEKIADAKNAWGYWQGVLAFLMPRAQTSIIRASWQMDTLHDDGKATEKGRRFVASMRFLRVAVDRMEKGR